MIEESLRQHGHGGAFGRVDRRVAWGVADFEQLVGIAVAAAELVVLLVIQSFQGGELPRVRVDGRSMCGR